jgi:hypothetical protein
VNCLSVDSLCNSLRKLAQRIIPRAHHRDNITGLYYPCNLFNNLFSPGRKGKKGSAPYFFFI